jgi:GNAT superfamily N-acetyltransferase
VRNELGRLSPPGNRSAEFASLSVPPGRVKLNSWYFRREKTVGEEISVREYSERYKDEIIDLILDIQRNEFNIPIRKEDQPDLSDVPGFYQHGAGNFWVALCNDRVVGTISLVDLGHNQLALRKMFVKFAYRGSRYGTAGILLQKSVEWAKQNRIKDIYLGTTEKFLAAHRFYEKSGFIQICKEELPLGFPVMKVDTRFYRRTL